MMLRSCAWIAIALLLGACRSPGSAGPVLPQESGLDLYIVRHAETMANVTRDYSPMNQRSFSSKGDREIVELGQKLSRLSIDEILVSPTYRTLHTIAPWLDQERRTAEIWPEIEECCFQSDRVSPASNPLPRGRPITVEAEVAALFGFRDAASSYWYNAQNYADSQRQVADAARLLRDYSGSGKTILMVTHYHVGAALISRLIDDEAATEIILRTAKITQLHQEPDGRFRLVSLNEAPFEGVY